MEDWVALHPYAGPRHTADKVALAALRSSCFRGALRVWQFQSGGRGGDLSRNVKDKRRDLLRGGVFETFRRAFPERVSVLEKVPLSEAEHAALVAAVECGHWESAERILCAPGAQLPPSETHWHGPPIITAAVKSEWEWGMARLESWPDRLPLHCNWSNGKLAMAAARAGTPRSLHYVERFLSTAPPSAIQEVLFEEVCRSCTLATAEWLRAPPRPAPSITAKVVREAIFGGRVELVEWLLSTKAKTAGEFMRSIPSQGLMDHAAAFGHLPVLRLLHQYELGKCSAMALSSAASNGDLATVQWLWDHDQAQAVSHVLPSAASAGALEVVEYLHDRCGAPWTASAADRAAQNGHVHVLEWSWRCGLALPQSLDGAAAAAHLETVEWLVAHHPDVQCSSRAVDGAALCGATRVLRWLLAHRTELPCSQKAVTNAISRGHVDVLDLVLTELGQPIPESALLLAAMKGSVEIVDLLRSRSDLAWTSVHAAMAAARGHVALLRYCLCNDLALPTSLDEAARAGHMDVVRFLHGHVSDVRCSPAALDGAIERDDLPMVRFLAQCRPESLSPHVLEHAAQRASLPILESLVLDGSKVCTPTVLLAAARATEDGLAKAQFLLNHNAELLTPNVVAGLDAFETTRHQAACDLLRSAFTPAQSHDSRNPFRR